MQDYQDIIAEILIDEMTLLHLQCAGNEKKK